MACRPPLYARDIEHTLRRCALGTRIVILVGPPGVGKTSLIRHIARQARYIDLSHRANQRRIEADAPRLLAGRQQAVILDGIDEAPGILPALAGNLLPPGNTWLIARSPPDLDLLRSLAIPSAVVHLGPLTLREIKGSGPPLMPPFDSPDHAPCAKTFLAGRLLRGGLPSIACGEPPGRAHAAWWGAYSAANKAEGAALTTLMIELTGRMGTLLTVHGLARLLRYQETQTELLLTKLIKDGLVTLLRPLNDPDHFAAFVFDTGFAAWLLRITTPASLLSSPYWDAILQAAVVAQVRGAYLATGRDAPLILIGTGPQPPGFALLDDVRIISHN